MIIFRYLAKEVFTTLFAITSVLLLVFMSNLFVRYLSQAAEGKFAAAIIFKLLGIQIPYLLGLLLPLGFFLSVLLAYGRLYADAEMTVMIACGMSKARLIMMNMLMATGLMLIVAYMMFYLNPHLLAYRNDLIAQAKAQAATSVIFPGRFQEIKNGQQVFYIADLSKEHNQAEGIFFAQEREPDAPDVAQVTASRPNSTAAKQATAQAAHPTWIVSSANSGHQYTDPNTGAEFVVAENGFRYDGVPGQKDMKITQFHQFGMRMKQKAKPFRTKENAMPTGKIWDGAGKNPRYMAELQWRISMPLATLILGLLSVSLSKIDPRRGKYTQLLPSGLVSIVYANLLFVARNLVKGGDVPSFLGMWWVHVIFLSLALVLLINRHTWSRWRKNMRNWRNKNKPLTIVEQSE